MKDILIINLTRMGDLIQTIPLIAGLKEKYHDIRITVLVNSAFSEICNSIPFIDRLITFDIRGLLRMLQNDRYAIVKGFNYIEDILNKVNETCYDMTINLTHSTDSAILLSLINTREMRGIGIDDEGHSVKRHPWIRYFFNVIPGRDYNPFHLCDMYLKVAGVMPGGKGLYLDLPNYIEEWVAFTLQKEGVGDNDLLIGIQLGASVEDKRWHVSSFARLADRLAERFGARILLTGSDEESCLGKEFTEVATTKPLNFIGKTNLNELAGLLKRCTLFISNDTGPLHIATAVGTRTVNISLASVHFRETGPYGEDHYVIEADIPCSPCGFQSGCKDMVCKEKVNVDNLFELVRLILTGDDLESIEDSPLWEDVQVYHSHFDDDGLIAYRPLIKRPLKKEMLFRHIYRWTWIKILDGGELGSLEGIHKYLNDRLHTWYDCDSMDLEALIGDDLDALVKLKTLSDIGFTKLTHIAAEAKRPSPDVGWIKDIWADVPNIERDIEVLGYTHPPLKPLTIIFKYGKEGLEGKGLSAMAEETRNLYGDLRAHTSMIIHLLECLIGSYKVVPVPCIYRKEGVWEQTIREMIQVS